MNTIDFLRANEHQSECSFVSRAQYLKDNWSWLKYAYAIAIKTRHRMKELGITQKELAKLLECTQQHISVLLGGKVNMTLETIAKLEQALDFDLMGRCLQEFTYLSDASASGALPDNFNASQFVDGYRPRKKKGPKNAK